MKDSLINLRVQLPDDYDYSKLEKEIEKAIKSVNGKLIDYDIDEI